MFAEVPLLKYTMQWIFNVNIFNLQFGRLQEMDLEDSAQLPPDSGSGFSYILRINQKAFREDIGWTRMIHFQKSANLQVAWIGKDIRFEKSGYLHEGSPSAAHDMRPPIILF